MPTQDDDWRLNGRALEDLQGLTLHWAQWTQTQPNWDHDHCEFCFAKFMEGDSQPNLLHFGWTDERQFNWICQTCFEDFKDRFQWQVSSQNE